MVDLVAALVIDANNFRSGERSAEKGNVHAFHFDPVACVRLEFDRKPFLLFIGSDISRRWVVDVSDLDVFAERLPVANVSISVTDRR